MGEIKNKFSSYGGSFFVKYTKFDYVRRYSREKNLFE